LYFPAFFVPVSSSLSSSRDRDKGQGSCGRMMDDGCGKDIVLLLVLLFFAAAHKKEEGHFYPSSP